LTQAQINNFLISQYKESNSLIFLKNTNFSSQKNITLTPTLNSSSISTKEIGKLIWFIPNPKEKIFEKKITSNEIQAPSKFSRVSLIREIIQWM
jgi:hypothetical protein